MKKIKPFSSGELLNHLGNKFLFVFVDAPVFVVTDSYTFSEGDGVVEVCVGIIPPADGLELDLIATLSVTDGLKAGTSKIFLS